MASVSEFIIRCKTENGSFIMKNVNSESTVMELKMHLSKQTNLKPENIRILCGYPPKALTDDFDSFKLKDVNIHSGETIIIEKKRAVARSAGRVRDSTSAGRVRDSTSAGRVCDSTSAAAAQDHHQGRKGAADQPAVFDELLTGGIMMRQVVPSNNSCLFTSVCFVLSNGDLNPEKSNELRRIIARVVGQNPDKYTSVILGMPNKDYCTWIQNTEHWGGGIELAILSEHFGIEIVAVDTVSLTLHRFGENFNYSNRIFLIYDGIHYDPLVVEMDNAPMQTIFPSNDHRPMEMALEVAQEAKSSRQYTDVANFTLQCSVCGERLRGDKEAREHAISTGHLNFGEVTK